MGENLNWPGWLLKDNPYGGEFDVEARQRMIRYSRLLLPFMEKYDVGRTPLELGPFFNPVLISDLFPGAEISYIDNDKYVVQYLAKRYPTAAVQLQNIDCLDYQKEHSAIVVSHLFNYINYRLLIRKMPDLLLPKGFFFLNNSPDYGLSPFFSAKRPRSNQEVIETVIKAGLKIKEYTILPSPNICHQPNERLLLVAQRI